VVILRLTVVLISCITLFNAPVFSQGTYIQSDLESHSAKPTPEEYKGKLHCATLDGIIANLEDAKSEPYCRDAALGCKSYQHLGEFKKRLKEEKKDSTIATIDFEDKLKKRIIFDLEVCELAIRHYNHGFFDRQ
jgi:hypothetical protein